MNVMSIKARIALISVTAMLPVAVMLMAMAWLNQERMTARIADAVLDGNQLIWDQLVEDVYLRMSQGIQAIGKEFELRNAIKQDSSEAIAHFVDRSSISPVRAAGTQCCKSSILAPRCFTARSAISICGGSMPWSHA